MTIELPRTSLADPAEGGEPVLTYVEGERDGSPIADLVELAPGAGLARAAAVLLAARPGWLVSGAVPLGEALIAAGARPVRHAHVLERGLADVPPEWAGARLPGRVELVAPATYPVDDVIAAHAAAFGPGHPDRSYSARTPEEQRESLRGLLAGDILGPLLPGSALAATVWRVVGGITVHDRVGADGADQPWIGTVFRDPDPAYAGLGEAMLRRALAALFAAGQVSVGLAVTDGNPARRLYERLGFALTGTSLTVQLPGAPSDLP